MANTMTVVRTRARTAWPKLLTAYAPELTLALWCLLLFLPGLNTGTLWRTEGLRAQISQECLHGHWLVPTLYGEPFLTKPPGQYVAIAACSVPTGTVTVASARLPSVFAGLGTVFVVYALAWHVLGRARGWLAGMVTPLACLWLDKVPSAEIDAAQVFWVALALAAGYRAGTTGGVWWLLALAAVAGGTLTKWTAPAFFYFTLIPWLIAIGRARQLVNRWHLLGVALAAGICTSWLLLAANAVGWEPLWHTIGQEATQRFNPHHGGRAYPWLAVLAFPFVAWAAHLPVSAVVLFHRWSADAAPPTRTLTVFAHCWLWPNVLFWSLLPEHAARYVFPIAPAFALLVAVHSPSRWLTPRRLVSVFGAWLLVKLVFVVWIMPLRTNPDAVAATVQELREKVPSGVILHLIRAKDEGIMFAYGRPVRRVVAVTAVPAGGWLLLHRGEWAGLRSDATVQWVTEVRDQQGDPLTLVRYWPAGMP
jgi:4-amino-4-deoxy-L-arabinose transferase-like glycosyltransferase